MTTPVSRQTSPERHYLIASAVANLLVGCVGLVVAAMSLLQQAGAAKVGLVTEPFGEGG